MANISIDRFRARSFQTGDEAARNILSCRVSFTTPMPPKGIMINALIILKTDQTDHRPPHFHDLDLLTADKTPDLYRSRSCWRRVGTVQSL